jgi:predicted esterase
VFTWLLCAAAPTFLVASIASSALAAPASYEPLKSAETVPGQPYERFTTRDSLGREITFYVSRASDGAPPAPCAVYIQGSGCTSVFIERDGRIRSQGGHSVVPQAAGNRARVVIVEKPGVRYLDKPEGDCREFVTFNEEHTLERWSEAVEAALLAARKLPGVDTTRALVIGHSEGGLVACRVARDLHGVVTHVASFAGGGPTQLFDLIELARQGVFFSDVSEDSTARAAFVARRWTEIQADPMSADQFFFGFAYRRWSTFLATSPMDELPQVSARIYIAQGVADRAVDPRSADALYAHLLTKGKDVTYDRVEGADHSFRIAAMPEKDGWLEVFERVFAWFEER